MNSTQFPQFSQVDLKHFTEQLDTMLSDNLKHIDEMLNKYQTFSWDNLISPLDDMDDALEQFWSPVSHLHAVKNSPEIREAYEACLPKLSAYEAAIGQNSKLYDAVQSIDTTHLDGAQKKIIQDIIKDFELSGVSLPPEKKLELETYQTRLSELSNQFENNVLDATQAYTLHIEDKKRLLGLPTHAVNTARALAESKGQEGWILTLEIPCFLAVMSYAEDRALRASIYEGFVTRASECGPHAGQFDNTAVMNEILTLRQQQAELLGFENYAEYSIATKMAESSQAVSTFLHNLGEKAHGQAKQEFEELIQFAKEHLNLDELKPYDVAFASEKKQQAEHGISQEILRPYFPLSKVTDGLFQIINRLYGMNLELVDHVDTWHEDVRCYKVIDDQNHNRGYLYVDLFARTNKRGGAWMNSLQSRRVKDDGKVQLPIATLTCNFAKTGDNDSAALSHDEVVTLFHEMGHCLHHLLTQVDYLGASGINNVEWDAVELPSQFFENWCFEEEALPLLTSHIETGEILPKALFDKLKAAKNFQSAMGMVRQLEFSLFDFRIHQEFTSKETEQVQMILDEVRQSLSVVPIAPYNRFAHSFSHIFAGGYAAGYYSYKWAEVLSSDAFSRFEEEGVFNHETGQAFLKEILEVGGSKKASDAFQAFRGRAPEIEPLLRHNGIKV